MTITMSSGKIFCNTFVSPLQFSNFHPLGFALRIDKDGIIARDTVGLNTVYVTSFTNNSTGTIITIYPETLNGLVPQMILFLQKICNCTAIPELDYNYSPSIGFSFSLYRNIYTFYTNKEIEESGNICIKVDGSDPNFKQLVPLLGTDIYKLTGESTHNFINAAYIGYKQKQGGIKVSDMYNFKEFKITFFK